MILSLNVRRTVMVHAFNYTRVTTAVQQILSCRSIMVSCRYECVPGCARMRMHAHSMHSRSYTCFDTHWNSLSDIDFLVEHPRHRLSRIIINSRSYSMNNISTWRTTHQRGLVVLSLILLSMPCSHLCCKQINKF